MVGLVIVSHSRDLAEAVVGLARQLASDSSPIAIAAGIGPDRREFGTDAIEIKDAIESVYDDDGVLVLMDLGSAILSAQMALELIDPSKHDRIAFCAAPLVEGALAAAVQINLGEDLETVCREAQLSLEPKREMLGSDMETVAPGTPAAPYEDLDESRRTSFVLTNPHGLHARPAARFVQEAARFEAQIQVSNQTTGKGPVNARSFNALATLGALRGHTIQVSASGPQAEMAMQALTALAGSGFGDLPEEGPPEVRPEIPPEGTSVRGYRGIPVSDGIALGKLHHFRPAAAPVPAHKVNDPAAAWEKLLTAISEVEITVKVRRKQIAINIGEDKAGIFDAHLLILRDPEMLQAVRERIFSDMENEAAAWSGVVRETAEKFKSLEDAYQKQRAADVTDIGDQVLLTLAGEATDRIKLDEPVVLIAEDLTPTQTAQLDLEKILGIVTRLGGPTSHSAILARSLGIPAVTGVPESLFEHSNGTTIAIDGSTGEFWTNPSKKLQESLENRRREWLAEKSAHEQGSLAPAVTLDGHKVDVHANVGSVQDAAAAVRQGAEGIGLLRTEFLFLTRSDPPDEADQYEAMREIGEIMGDRPVTVRTLDVGGDKPLPYIHQPPEANPFLGVRAIRLSLNQPGLFQTQLRAILRAGYGRNFRVMFPMIATLVELHQAKAALERAHKTLAEDNIPHAWPIETGIMVEVPAAALTASIFAPHVDFFSIGTNDLTQYTFAAERGNPNLSSLSSDLHPAVLRLVKSTVIAAAEHGKWVGVCGELAGDPKAAALLLGLGVDELSLSPAGIPRLKAAVRELNLAAASALAAEALDADNAEDVRKLIE